MVERAPHGLFIGAATSVAAHAVLASALFGGPDLRRERVVPTAVSINVVTPPRQPPPPEKPRPEVEPSRPRIPSPAATSAASRAEPERAQPEPAEEPEPAPLELHGVTLTNEGEGAAWSSAVGDGRAGVSSGSGGRARPSRPAAAQAPAREARAPRTVSVADLSRKPVPPALEGLLASQYPPELRRRAVGGQAVVRARIDPDGVVRSCNVVSESESGFGGACRRTVLGSRWSPPLDRAGAAVATHVSYTCRFRIDG